MSLLGQSVGERYSKWSEVIWSLSFDVDVVVRYLENLCAAVEQLKVDSQVHVDSVEIRNVWELWYQFRQPLYAFSCLSPAQNYSMDITTRIDAITQELLEPVRTKGKAIYGDQWPRRLDTARDSSLLELRNEAAIQAAEALLIKYGRYLEVTMDDELRKLMLFREYLIGEDHGLYHSALRRLRQDIGGSGDHSLFKCFTEAYVAKGFYVYFPLTQQSWRYGQTVERLRCVRDEAGIAQTSFDTCQERILTLKCTAVKPSEMNDAFFAQLKDTLTRASEDFQQIKIRVDTDNPAGDQQTKIETLSRSLRLERDEQPLTEGPSWHEFLTSIKNDTKDWPVCSLEVSALYVRNEAEIAEDLAQSTYPLSPPTYSYFRP